jgi:hypothetical protein
VTLIFSDMHDYTGMTERLGDHAALRDGDKFFGKTVIQAFRVAVRGPGTGRGDPRLRPSSGPDRRPWLRLP